MRHDPDQDGRTSFRQRLRDSVWSVLKSLALVGVTTIGLLILDQFRGRLEGPDLPRLAARIVQAYQLAYLAVEQVGIGLSPVQDMKRGAPWEKPPRPALAVKGLTPQGDKVSRALTLAARMQSGHVYIPKTAPWLPTLEAELAIFPNGQHDDQVDALAYAALEAMHFGESDLRAD